MSHKLVTIDPDATVAEAQGLMEKHGIHELPVMSNSTLKGWISYGTIGRHGGASPRTKVQSVMEQPPRIQKDALLVEAADLMIRNNTRAVPVVDGKGKVVGVLSRTDILRAAVKVPELASLPIANVMNTELETIPENESVDRAVSRLRETHIGQLLVVDENGKLSGHVRLEDLLRAHAADHAPESKAGRKSTRRTTTKRPSQVEAKGFLIETPTVPRKASLADAVRLMTEQGTTFCAVVEDGFAVGVVSRSNIVERVANLKPSQGVLCQIVGLADHVDGSDLDAIYSEAQKTLQKVSTEVKIEFLSLHFKVYNAKTEGDEKFALTAHLSTEGPFIVQKADAWDPLEAARLALDGLERRVVEIKDLRLEKRKGPPRRAAAFYTATRP